MRRARLWPPILGSHIFWCSSVAVDLIAILISSLVHLRLSIGPLDISKSLWLCYCYYRRSKRDAEDEEDDDEDEEEEEEEGSEEEESEEEEVPSAAVPQQQELSRADRKALKKQGKKKETAEEDGDEDDDPLLANPNRTIGRMKISDLNTPREPTRKER